MANLFSSKFKLETLDSDRDLKYTQTWKKNMSLFDKPTISSGQEKKSYTRVSFIPDLNKFDEMKSLKETDIIAIIKKRAYDMAGIFRGKLKVWLNDEKIELKSFKDYIHLFLPEEQKLPLIHTIINDRWEVGVSYSDGHADQISFVNSIATTRGGTHVSYITDQICKRLVEYINKKYKSLVVKSQYVKNHLFVFINALIDNPKFDTQTKSCLTTKRSEFGSTCELPEKFIKEICKSSIVDQIVLYAQYQSNKGLKKNDGKKQNRINVPKLEDANFAGGKDSEDCTIILTEGDSAKALVVSGLSVVGRDKYGVFPLRGKVLNVREANNKQIQENKEIRALKRILGLKQGIKYTDTKDLRYGHVMLFSDQDHDGSHIKGLVINLFATFWPELLHMPGFLQEFITPIIKVKKGNNIAKEKSIKFYSIPEFEKWKKEHNDAHGWTIKYYKGLGTSTSSEAKEYFSSLNVHQLKFDYTGTECMDAIKLAFAKEEVDARKKWVQEYKLGTYLDQSKGKLTYKDFINKELILYSVADNQRSIPSLIDGLKPSQRKILYVCFKRNLTKEIKVAQLAGKKNKQLCYIIYNL